MSVVAVPRSARRRGSRTPVRGRPLGVAGLIATATAGAVVGLAPVAAAATGGPRAVVVAGTGRPGSGTGPARRAALDAPTGIAVGPSGTVFVADTGNCRVVEITGGVGSATPGSAARVRVVAGDGCGRAVGPAGSPATRSGIGAAQGLAVDGAGDLFIADTSANEVLEVPGATTVREGRTRRAGHVYTVAGGTAAGGTAAGATADGATAAGLDAPEGLAVDGAGDLFIADTGHCEVREVPVRSGTQFGVPVTAGQLATVAGSGACGTIAGAGVATGDGGPALHAVLWTPTAVALDAAGDLLIADRGNDAVREVAAVAGTYFGVPIGADDVATVAGSGSGYGPYLVDGLSATGPTAGLNFVSGIAFDPRGDLFVADLYDRAVREVAGATGTSFGRPVTTGDLYTLVGAIPTGATGNQTRWVLGRVTYPAGVAVAPSGAVVFTDRGANVVRAVFPPGP